MASALAEQHTSRGCYLINLAQYIGLTERGLILQGGWMRTRSVCIAALVTHYTISPGFKHHTSLMRSFMLQLLVEHCS